MKTLATTNAPIHGNVSPGFEAVQTAFARNFTERGELGSACTIYYRGEKVVDLWGGYRNPQKTLPWQEDTMVIVFSSTKGFPFVSKHSHQNQVDMAAIAPNLGSLAALFHKSTCAVGAHRPLIRRIYTQPHFVLIAILESILEEKTDCFSSISLSPIGFISDNDSKFARLGSLIKMKKFANAYYLSIALNPKVGTVALAMP